MTCEECPRPRKPPNRGADVAARANCARLRADADTVVRRLLADATARQIAAEYGVGLKTVEALYRVRAAKADRTAARARKAQAALCRRGTGSRRRRPLGTVVTLLKAGRWVKYIKVCDGGPKHLRWMKLSRYVWQAARGPVPPGHRVAFADGDGRNCDLSNLACVPEREDCLRALAAADPGRRNALAARARRKRAAAERVKAAIRVTGLWECGACGLDRRRCRGHKPGPGCRKCGRHVWRPVPLDAPPLPAAEPVPPPLRTAAEKGRENARRFIESLNDAA